MNRREYDKKYKSNMPSLLGALIGGIGVSNVGDAIKSSHKLVNATQTSINNMKPNRRIEQRRDFLIIKIQEGRGRLLSGKKSMFLGKNNIRMTVQELVSLERLVSTVRTKEELNNVNNRVCWALGWI